MAGLAKQKLAGRIKWLPPKDEIYPDEPGLYKGCCDHPVVILSSRADIAGRVDFLIQSTSRQRPPAFLDLGSPRFTKNSYVGTSHIYSIAFTSLWPYNRSGTDVFLSTSSYRTLVQRVGFKEALPALPPTFRTYTGRVYQSASTATSANVRYPSYAVEYSDHRLPTVIDAREADPLISPYETSWEYWSLLTTPHYYAVGREEWWLKQSREALCVLFGVVLCLLSGIAIEDVVGFVPKNSVVIPVRQRKSGLRPIQSPGWRVSATRALSGESEAIGGNTVES
ncbi:hypothetical protein F5Y17DRAFT_460951 [Xylariaceae sp. FL0594]|nr:hypothetical protein F5Y17DRAFT_460951 [Xylariaceae sp. FL0594]